MDQWDVFQSDRLEIRRGLTTREVRSALDAGELRDDDLVRPAGTSIPWARLADLPALAEPEPPAPPAAPSVPGPDEIIEPAPDEVFPPPSGEFVFEAEEIEDTGPRGAAIEPEPDRDEELELVDEAEAKTVVAEPPADLGRYDLDLGDPAHRVALPIGAEPLDAVIDESAEEDEEEYDPLEEDEAIAEFTLSRGSAETIEEIDLAPMVDVAFQLVLFFLVTATTVLFKTLEIPKPNPEPPPEAGAAQGMERPRTMEDLQEQFILVGIDPQGNFTIDKEPVPADRTALAERLNQARAETQRRAMLLTADSQTLHRYAVIAYDAANEIGLGIAIARPSTRPSP